MGDCPTEPLLPQFDRRLRLRLFGAKVVRHAEAVAFQLAEVAVPRALLAAILRRIGRLRAAPSPG